MSQIFIETRGKSIDYRFIVKSPSRSWWREYSQYTAFENPTFIINNTSESCDIYLSAIPSLRKDRTQTTIRYTLVANLTKNDTNLNVLNKLVLIWLEEVKLAPDNLPKISQIGDLLDNCFPEKFIEELLLEKQPNGEGENKFQQGLQQFIDGISRMTSSESKSEYTSRYKVWYGGIDNYKSHNTWISLVDELLNQRKEGKALLLNLAGENDLKELLITEQHNHQNNQNIGLLIIENDQEPTEVKYSNHTDSIQELVGYFLTSFVQNRAMKFMALFIFIALFVVIGGNFFLKTIF